MKSSLNIVPAIIALALGFSSCSTVFDDLSDCPSGQFFRFVYERNITGGDAFDAQVEKVTLAVFDEAGRYVTTLESDASALEDGRLRTELAPGRYSFISWCWSGNAASEFAHSDAQDFGKDSMTLRPGEELSQNDPASLWQWSEGAMEINDEGEEYTVSLTKDTNDILVMLQQSDGSSLDPSLFDFSIKGHSRTILGKDNKASGDILYAPFHTSEKKVGGDASGNGSVGVACAEFGVSRLVAGTDTRLVITRKDNGDTVIDLPLIDYLAIRSEKYMKWSDQEYLDRECDYSLMFFLDKNLQWIKSTIVVNGWTVRVNNI